MWVYMSINHNCRFNHKSLDVKHPFWIFSGYCSISQLWLFKQNLVLKRLKTLRTTLMVWGRGVNCTGIDHRL